MTPSPWPRNVPERDVWGPTGGISVADGKETRAYPLRVLVWHEIVNDQIGDLAFAVTYCPLCGTAMVFNRWIGNRAFSFGVSGLLYQSDVLLYDRETDSLWSQMGLICIAGAKLNTSLSRMASAQMTWAAWKRRYARGTVLSPDTRHPRDYSKSRYESYEVDSALIAIPTELLPENEERPGTIGSYPGIFRPGSLPIVMTNTPADSPPPKSHLKWLLPTLATISVCALLFGPQFRRELLIRFLVSTEIPSQSAFEELIQSVRDPVPILERMWATEKTVHRELVGEHLKRKSAPGAPPDPRVESLLIAAAHDPNASVREIALGALAILKHPRLVPIARTQLRNSDPQIRLLGLQYLSRSEARQALPAVIRLLDDPELRIVATAEAALKKWTGEDFGVRIHYAIPQMEKDNPQRASLDPANLEKIRQGVERRKVWWVQHRQEYPEADAATNTESDVPLPPLAATDFTLPDLGGKTVRLSDFRGKIVLLNFWTTWCSACLAEIPDLIQIQKRHGDRVVVLGVSLDGVPDTHGHGEGHREGEVSDHGREGGDGDRRHEEVESPTLKKIRDKVARLVKSKGITYHILLDPKNEVGGRFNGGELPTNVLIDAQGRVRRRFIGARPPARLGSYDCGDQQQRTDTERQSWILRRMIKIRMLSGIVRNTTCPWTFIPVWTHCWIPA